MSLADDFRADAGVTSAPQVVDGPLTPAEQVKFADSPRIEVSGVASGAPSLADQFREDAKPAAADASAKDGSSSSTPWDEAMRQIGLTARAGVTGIAGIPNIAGDAANSLINLGTSGINKLAGTNIPQLQMPSQSTQQLMDKVGVPQPKNATERVVQDIAGAMAGTGGFVKAGNALSRAASPVLQAVGDGMSQLPGMQIVGAAGAGAGGGIARENGAGPVGQIASGLFGGLIGAVAPSAALSAARGARNTAGNMAGAVHPIINPQRYVGSQLAQAIGPDAGVVAGNIRSAQEFVPGSMPTTAQAGAGPTLVATEKSLANSNPDFKIALSAREADNNAARWQALNGVALTQDELEAAKEARSAITGPMYDAAHQQTANVGKSFIQFAQRPAVQQAMNDADMMARNEGVALKWPTPSDRAISGQALDYTSRALADKISTLQRSGSPQEVRALTEAQNYLKNWTEQYVPGVREAAADYSTLSSPVNTMEAGQQISAALGTRGMDANGLPQIQLSPYKAALVQALKKQDFGIDEGAHQALQGIGQDLQRSTISNSLKSPGSDTAYNVAANGWLARQIYGQNFGGATGLGKTLGALGATATGHPIVGLGLLTQGNKLGQMAGSRLNAQLADMLLNPSKLLPYLDGASPKQTTQALANALRGNVSQGVIGAAPAVRSGP